MTTELTEYNLSAEELAAKLDYGVQYVRFLARVGRLPGLKRGRAWRFNEGEVLNFLKAETEKNANGDSTGSDLLR